jgi:shikimate dehydrogenase
MSPEGDGGGVSVGVAALRVSAATRLAAVIGAPVDHSLSPALHNAAFAAAGIDAVYLALHVAPADLAAAVAGFRALGILGVSVTVPHKERVVALCDRVVAPADAIGAVNCLCFERRGKGADQRVDQGADQRVDQGEDPGAKVIGHNTDAHGFVASLNHDLGVDPRGARVVLLGAGGAARAVHAGLAGAGADISAVIARRPERAAWVASGAVRPWTAAALDQALARCDLLVDCTSLGLDAEREARAPVPVNALPDHAIVASLIYHREPALLRQARARGLTVLGGAGMLVYQGARAFELWTGVDAPIAAMWAAMRAALAMEA